MYITCKKILPLLALTALTLLNPVTLDAGAVKANELLSYYANYKDQMLDDKGSLPAHISPFVIPPKTHLNNYKLLMVVGQDENDVPLQRAIDFSPTGFTTVLHWNTSQITSFREAAIQWYIERFGIDFSEGTYDPVTGVVTADFGLMIPYTYSGYERVLLSNNCKIPAYTKETPSSIVLVQYAAIFFSAPTYTGTYAQNVPGGAIVGSVSDALDYGCFKVFLNYKGTKSELFFVRSYYPSIITEDNAQPTRNLDRYQMNSPTFGPGYGTADSSFAYAQAVNNIVAVNAISVWRFPGAYMVDLLDYNGFLVPPVVTH